METLDAQFNGALKRVNLGDKVDRAKKAHEAVRDVLAADDTLKGYGATTILIGSYGRDVAIWPGHDVDVFCRLPDFDADPETLYAALQRPLKEAYEDRLDDTGAHALSVAWGDDFSVDVVGGAPKGGHWVIPAKSDLGRMTDWDESDPELLGELAEERNESPKVNDQGAFKPIVKLVRQIRNEHLGDERPKGLYMEMLTYWVFTWGQVSGSTFAEILTTTLEGIAEQLESDEVIADPALGKDFAPAPTPDQIKNAATKFREQATEARTALAEERCPAAARWRRIVGRNGNGWVFPLPEGCDDKGNSIRSVTEVASLGPQEARGFAS